MSLINEALKKAQAHDSKPPADAYQGLLPKPAAAPPKRKRRYLWGFLISLLLVSSISLSLTYFFVSKLLQEEAQYSSPAAQPVPQSGSPAQPNAAVAQAPHPSAQAPHPSAQAPLDPHVPPAAQQDAPAPISPPLPPPAPSPATAHPAAPALTTATPDPAPQQPAIDNTALQEYLHSLVVRAVLAGGARLLIFDPQTGRSKAYQRGDRLDSPYPLLIIETSSNSITLQDDAGQRYTKRF